MQIWWSIRQSIGALVSPHEVYKRLGLSDESPQLAYTTLFETIISTVEIQAIGNGARFLMPNGDSRFKQQIERMINRKIGYAHRGRQSGSNEAVEKPQNCRI